MNTFTDTGSGRQARKTETRSRLLTHARELFAQEGYDATTIRGVAQAAGVAVGTVFVHFPNKAALLAAILNAQLDGALKSATKTLPSAGARRRIRHVLQALFRSYARYPSLSRVLLKETLFAPGQQHEAALADVGAFTAMLGEWCSEPGTLRPNLEPGDAAEAIFAAYLVALVEGLGQERPKTRRMLARVEQLTAPWFADTEGGST